MEKDTIQLARQVRFTSLMMVHRAKASHIGSALSIADILAVLYGQVMEFNPQEPESPSRDRLILSKGHACVANYAVLNAIGTLSDEEILTYGQDFSPLMNHISHKARGVEFSTGALGHGLPFGVGKALAARNQGAMWRVFVILSDGELGEGSNWEAFLFAAHHGLDNLTVVIDFNNLQSLTTVDRTLGVEPLEEKLRAFGWRVIDVDGHDHQALSKSLESAAVQAGRPTVLIARTIKGKGVSFMEDKVEWHYKSPDNAELQQAKQELGFA
jgi:transketolase